MTFKKYPFTIDQIEERIKRILPQQRSEPDINVLKSTLSFVDLTTLEGSDNTHKIDEICNKALNIRNRFDGELSVAAICVYPVFVKQVKNALKGTGIKVASVAGAFPSGQSPLGIRLDEIKNAVDQGADEIDTVISRGRFLAGEFDTVHDEIAAMREASKDVHLKVILETGELGSVENIRKASEIAIQAGADFIKTSTGKIQPAATKEAAVIMLDTIHEYFKMSGKRIGFKPAGGISTAEDAFSYYALTKEICGDEWLTPDLFRIGASRLVDRILMLI